MEEEEHDNLGKHSKNQIISSEKKKKLMKKLARIKLNKSRGNASFFDISAFYEAKVRKLKLNNISLAKGLSEQKQVSQTWYDTVVSLKEELHDSQESLLRLHYQVKENGDYEHVIQESVERRFRSISEPLEASVTNSLKNVYDLVENLTKMKQLLASAKSFNNNKEKLNFSRRSSHSMHGSRPPLSQNSKSPRKNVVHPMVEGHVLQPATIPIPRMTLEDRRRYRLQEQVEIGMEVIGELSTTENDSTSSDIDDSTTSDHQNVEEENTNCHHIEDATDDITTAAESSNLPSHDDDDESIDNDELNITLIPKVSALDEGKSTPESEDPLPEENHVSALDEGKTTPESEDPLPEENHVASGTENPDLQNSEETLKSPEKAEKRGIVCDEDPLEGSSWMHLKKGRAKKRKAKSGKSSLLRTSGLHFMPDTSSESEDEYVEMPVAKIKHGKVKGSARGRPSRSKSSKVSVSNLDILGSNVSRRSKKSGSCSISSARESKEPPTDLIDQVDEPRSSVLASFILNDSQTDTLLNENSDPKENHASPKHENPITWENKFKSLTPPNLGLKLDPVVNLTCILDASMEITECLTKEVLQSLAPFTEPSVGDAEAASRFDSKIEDENFVLKTDDSQNSSTNMISEETSEKLQQPPKNLMQESKKNKKYFKTTMKEKEMNEFVSGKKIETNLYNLSLMDASQVGPSLTNVGKENVPPSTNNNSSDDLGMKMKDISIVVRDIMKTPSPTVEADLSVPFYGFPNTSNNQSKNNTPIKSNKTTKEKSKMETKQKQHASPLKKKPNKSKKINYSENCAITILLSSSGTEDDDVWTPPKKSNKRKTKYTKKRITSRKKLKKTDDSTAKNITLSNTTSGRADENGEIEPIAEANDVEEQKSNPLCEIAIESNTLDSVPPDIFKDVNDIIRKHIKQEMDQINVYENYEVIDLNSDDNEPDPLAIEDPLDPLLPRPRRATLKVQSFKEPPLNTKMRRKSMGKKVVKRAPKKKSVKT